MGRQLLAGPAVQYFALLASLQVDAKLRSIMHSIYRSCKAVAEEFHTTLAAGAARFAALRTGQCCHAASQVYARYLRLLLTPLAHTPAPLCCLNAGANIAGFLKVAEAQRAQGAV